MDIFFICIGKPHYGLSEILVILLITPMTYLELSLLHREHSVNIGCYFQAWEPKFHLEAGLLL